MKKYFLLLTAVLVLWGGSLHAAQIMVFAAASLADSLKEIAPVYEKQSGDQLVFNFGASSLLARQIEAGAPADVFFSADEAKMDALDFKKLILPETRRNLLSNSLVIIVPADSPLKTLSPAELAAPAIKHLALADPKAVPAGVYAREFLEKQKLWDAMKGKVVPTGDVRAALAAVESGNVDAGMVYKTDAAISKKVKVLYEIPPAEGPAITYPVAVIKDSKNIAAAQKLVDHLQSPRAKKIFQAYGFVVVK